VLLLKCWSVPDTTQKNSLFLTTALRTSDQTSNILFVEVIFVQNEKQYGTSCTIISAFLTTMKEPI
jgi:hypothetical protein